MSTSTRSTRIHRRHRPVGHSDRPENKNAADLTTIQQELLAVTMRGGDVEQAGAAFADLALQLTNADLVLYVCTHDADEPSLISASRVDQPEVAFTQDQIFQLTRRVMGPRQPAVLRTEQAALISVPVVVSEQQTDVMTACLSIRSGALEPLVVSLQLVAAYATMWWQQKAMQQIDWEADMTSGIVEIIAAIGRSGGMSEASMLLANHFHELSAVDQVAVGWRNNSRNRLTLRAASDRATVDRSSESGRLWENAMNESLLRQVATHWPPVSHEDRAGLLAHKKLAVAHQAAAAMTIPMRGRDDVVVGAITLLSSNAENSRLAAYAETAVPFLTAAMETAQRLEGGRMWKAFRQLTEFSISRSKQIAVGILLLVAILLVPIQHKIGCDCEIAASARRFVVAPHDGILKETLVKPGDIVAANQLLATMDDRELNWELSTLIAERDRAAKQYDVALSKNESAKMQMSRLEVQRNDLKIKLLQYRKETLDIRATVAGVVLRGDLQDVQQTPVKTGQSLFEIAPLDQLRLDIRLPEQDVTFVAAGLPVELYLDALPNQPLSGMVTRIQPQAEVLDAKNVFVAEVEFDEVPPQLRPGLQGTAKVIADRRALGWVYFHRPWQRLVNFLR